MKITKSQLKQIIKEEISNVLAESDLGPEYNIPLRIGYGTYNVFQRYWNGQTDPLYAVLSRRGDSVDWAVVDASQEEVDRMREVAEEIIDRNEDEMEVRTARNFLKSLD